MLMDAVLMTVRGLGGSSWAGSSNDTSSLGNVGGACLAGLGIGLGASGLAGCEAGAIKGSSTMVTFFEARCPWLPLAFLSFLVQRAALLAQQLALQGALFREPAQQFAQQSLRPFSIIAHFCNNRQTIQKCAINGELEF